METRVVFASGLWKGVVAIAVMIAIGAGIWAYQASKQLTLVWDPLPTDLTSVTSIRIYEVTDLANPILVAEAQCTITQPYSCPTEATFTMSRAAHSYIARYWNGTWEGPDSNSFSIPGPPPAPTGLRKK